VADLRRRLEVWFRTFVNPLRDGADKGVTGCGQLDLAENNKPGRPVFAEQHLVGADWDLWMASDKSSTRT
jgi:hypothetical protein